MSKRRTYSNQFKLDVIKQSYQRYNIRELADELGIDPVLIYAWRSKYKKQPQGISGQRHSQPDTRTERAGRAEERTG